MTDNGGFFSCYVKQVQQKKIEVNIIGLYLCKLKISKIIVCERTIFTFHIKLNFKLSVAVIKGKKSEE